MPITRRRRANPPDEPENNNHLADQTSSAAESLAAEPASAPAVDGDDADGLAIEHTEEISVGKLECGVVIGRKASWTRIPDRLNGKRERVGIEWQRFLDVEGEDDFDSRRLLRTQIIEKLRCELGVAVAHDGNRYEVRNLPSHV